ncbi:MAG: acetylglutamate kinase [Aestuariibacter sp.]
MTTLVIKIGGALLHDESQLSAFFTVIAKLSGDHNCVLIHGGGDFAQDWLTKLGLTSTKINGVRVTPKAHLPYVAGALAGYVNTRLCAVAKANGVNPVGLNLGDGGICQVVEKSPELGAVAEVIPGRKALLTQLLANDYVPIVSSIATDNNGNLFNVNADDAAAGLAELLGSPLLLLSDVPGVLDQNKHVIQQLDANSIQYYIETGVIQGGMVVKVQAALNVAKRTGQPVIIASWKQPELLLSLDGAQAFGTTILSSATNSEEGV